MMDLSQSWDMLRRERDATPMPEEYRNKRVAILCNDCEQHSDTIFHIVGLECTQCGSFNTKRT